MAKRALLEEDSAEAASIGVKLSKEAKSGVRAVVAKVATLPIGRTVVEGEAKTSEEEMPAVAANEDMPGIGPFWDLLALTGYKPWY